MRKLFSRLPQFRSVTLCLLVSAFLVATGNFSFFRQVEEAYPIDQSSVFPLASVALVLLCCTQLVLSIFAFRKIVKLVLGAFLLTAATIRFFTDSYGLVFDETMINNILRTDRAEAYDLIGWRLAASILIFGLLPILAISQIKLKESKTLTELWQAMLSILGSLVFALLLILCFSKFYASFFREHKGIRSYENPLYSFYSIGKVAFGHFGESSKELTPIGQDARIPAVDAHKELIILVVGETARADRFSLNGYNRETNPLLKKEDVISFSDVSACGTSTATSVPCMFSGLGRSGYSDAKARRRENLLDILVRTGGISVSWRDNNSDSKGVADRISSKDFKTSRTNRICDAECRDVGMLEGLQEYVDRQSGDILIVLHQMGNHGPAYYKRYPKEFELFRPTCQSNELEKCSLEEINNAYDNAILYTDFFLSKVIEFLRKNSEKYEAGMIYLSDHGESLGEKGIFLHGLPYILAPAEQKKVPMIVWLNDRFRQDHPYNVLRARSKAPVSHDNLFHSILGLFKVETTQYQRDLDVFRE